MNLAQMLHTTNNPIMLSWEASPLEATLLVASAAATSGLRVSLSYYVTTRLSRTVAAAGFAL